MKKRILFVDDEPNILSSMKRMLRSLRKTTVMDFVESGRAALVAMETEPYDLVISDMRMPGMDGAELLALIRDRWPHTIRIMLTGQADSDSLLRTVNVVHKFLLKPCEQDDIKKCIASGCALHSFLLGDDSGDVDAYCFDLDPLYPQVYQDVQNSLLSDDCTVELLAECLDRDDWMSSTISTLCQFGKDDEDSSQAISMVDAITELGREVLRPLILSLYLFEKLIAKSPNADSFKRVLIHGMRIGWQAKKICQIEKASERFSAQALIGGLLHDIGYLLLANHKPEQYREAFGDLLVACQTFDSCEQDVFEFSHNKAGALFLVNLAFPLEIIEIVAFHSQPARCLAQVFNGLTAVHVADSFQASIDNPSCCCVLDEEYLAGIGCMDKLSVWEKIV